MSSRAASAGPAFTGYVETTGHALRLVYAAIQGIVPRTSRRLNDSERRTMIKSGAIFVFSVAESGIKRWTDGMLWSPSRIQGNFLVYRELSEKGFPRTASNGASYPTEIGTIKPNGLMKKTITITYDGADFHLVSYYKREDISAGRLQRPTSANDIMRMYLPPSMFQLDKLRSPPKIDRGRDGIERINEREEPSSELRELSTAQSPISTDYMRSSSSSRSPQSQSSSGTSRLPPMGFTRSDEDLPFHYIDGFDPMPQDVYPSQMADRRFAPSSLPQSRVSLPPLSLTIGHGRHASHPGQLPYTSSSSNPWCAMASQIPSASTKLSSAWGGSGQGSPTRGDSLDEVPPGSYRSRTYHGHNRHDVQGQAQGNHHSNHYHPYHPSGRSSTPGGTGSGSSFDFAPSPSSSGSPDQTQLTAAYSDPEWTMVPHAHQPSPPSGGYRPASSGHSHGIQSMYAGNSTTNPTRAPIMAKLEEEQSSYPLFNSTEQSFMESSPSSSTPGYGLYTDNNNGHHSQLAGQRGSGIGNNTGWATQPPSMSRSSRGDSSSSTSTRFASTAAAAGLSMGSSSPGSSSLARGSVTGTVQGMNTSPGNECRPGGGPGSRSNSSGYTYGASSSISLRASPGSGMVGAGDSISPSSPSSVPGSSVMGGEVKTHTLPDEYYR